MAKTEKTFGHAVSRPTLDEWLAVFSCLDRAGAEFLKVDVETALTFSQTALEAIDGEKRERNRRSARKAYDTVVRLRAKIDLSDAESKDLDFHLQRLKSELIQLGETF
jgi:hypothetical protein